MNVNNFVPVPGEDKHTRRRCANCGYVFDGRKGCPKCGSNATDPYEAERTSIKRSKH